MRRPERDARREPERESGEATGPRARRRAKTVCSFEFLGKRAAVSGLVAVPRRVRPLARRRVSRRGRVGSLASRVWPVSRPRAYSNTYALTLARAAAGRPGVCRGGLGKHTPRRAPARPARPSPRPNRPTPSPPTPAVLGGLRCSSSSRAQISMTQSPSSHVTARAGVCGWRLRDTASMRGPRQLRAHRARAPSSQRTSIFDE